MENNCSLCGYEITNPLCIGCLKKGDIAFFKNRPHLIEDIENIATNLSYFSMGNNRCVSCKQRVSTCSYCFHIKIHSLLKRKNESIAEEFIRLFNHGITPGAQFRY